MNGRSMKLECGYICIGKACTYLAAYVRLFIGWLVFSRREDASASIIRR